MNKNNTRLSFQRTPSVILLSDTDEDGNKIRTQYLTRMVVQDGYNIHVDIKSRTINQLQFTLSIQPNDYFYQKKKKNSPHQQKL
jgi:5S rRNA maturation endonuclease (ribonuclease M5)